MEPAKNEVGGGHSCAADGEGRSSENEMRGLAGRDAGDSWRSCRKDDNKPQVTVRLVHT